MLFPITNSASPSMNRQVIDRLSIVGRNPSVVPLSVTGSAIVTAVAATTIPFIVRGAVDQTAYLQQWQNSVGTILGGISSGTLQYRSISRPTEPIGGNGIAIGSCALLDGFTGIMEFGQGQGGQFIWTQGPGGVARRDESAYSNRVTMTLSTMGAYHGVSARDQAVTLCMGNGLGTLFSGNVNYDGEFYRPGSSTPDKALITGTSGVGGTTTNLIAGALILSAGLSTGNAVPAELILRSSIPVASGAALQTPAKVLTITNASTITLAESVNVVTGTVTGTKYGTATAQKQSFWNVAPVIQPASAFQAAVLDNTSGVAVFVLVDVGVVGVTSPTFTNNNFATLARQINEIRNVLVNTGLMKGAV